MVTEMESATDRECRERYRAARLLVFDLDGTLLDSLEDIAAAVNALRAELALPALAIATVRAAIGEGARTLLERCCAQALVHEVDLDSLYGRFMHHYRRACVRQPRLYPEVRPFLDIERGRVPCAILTNKPREITQRTLAAAELSHAFARVLCPEDLASRKPNPAGLHLLAREFAVTPAEVVYVGDSTTDFATGAAARVFTVGLRSGYYQPGEPAPCRWYDTFAEFGSAWRRGRAADGSEEASNHAAAR
jgi:phosphoglycolate phosphatase